MENKTDFKKLFQDVKDLKVEQPFLETRVLAHLEHSQKIQKKVLFWQVFSGISLSFSLFLLFWNLKVSDNKTPQAYANTSYVIHLNFDETDKANVAQAEIELPDDVYFVKANNEKLEERKLKLPVTIKEIGRGKLPFVLASKAFGTKDIAISLLDEDNNLIKRQTLKLKFAISESTLNSRKE